MTDTSRPVVAGVDLGGNAINYTFVDGREAWLIDGLCEHPARSKEGPEICLQQIAGGLDIAAVRAGIRLGDIVGVGLDTPGPASAGGVLSARGSTNFVHPDWAGFDIREGLERKLGKPVTYLNDGNAGALWGHYAIFGAERTATSISAIIGTGLGGGVIADGNVIKGRKGFGGELGHVLISTHGLLAEGQPVPRCNCGNLGDAESVASLTGMENNLLPYWLTRFPEHDLNGVDPVKAARAVRGYGERFDPLALKIFEQQAQALGRLFSIASNVTDPHAYFVGGGVVEAAPDFRAWFLRTVEESTVLRDEQRQVAQFAVVPDLDMAGARGSAIAALGALR